MNIKKITLSLVLIFMASHSFAENIDESIIHLPLIPYMTYRTLPEKLQPIDNVCRFKSDQEKNDVMTRMCRLGPALKDIIEKRRTVIYETQTFFNSCNFIDVNHVEVLVEHYCQIQTLITRKKILEHFCSIKKQSHKDGYINRLKEIVDLGPTVQKKINYNRSTELEAKHAETQNPQIYDVKKNPHVEAAYELGVIYGFRNGFSNCGMRDFDQSFEYFQEALDKPQAFFMVAELYRSRKNYKDIRRVYEFYNYAIELNIKNSAYNLALYIYEQLRSKAIHKTELPSVFTYKKVVQLMQISAKRHNVAAYNDLPILLRQLHKRKNQKKIQDITRIYLRKAAQKNFEPALYNQVINILSAPCTDKGLVIIEQNLKYLIKRQFQGAVDLLYILVKKECYKKLAENLLAEFKKDRVFSQSNVSFDNIAFRKLSHKLALNAFKPYDKFAENTLR